MFLTELNKEVLTCFFEKVDDETCEGNSYIFAIILDIESNFSNIDNNYYCFDDFQNVYIYDIKSALSSDKKKCIVCYQFFNNIFYSYCTSYDIEKN